MGAKDARAEVLAKIIRDNGFKRYVELGAYDLGLVRLLHWAIPELRIYAVDLWDNQDPYCYGTEPPDGKVDVDLEAVYDDATALASLLPRVTLCKGYSWEWGIYFAEEIKEDLFDLIFIDANHATWALFTDLVSWSGAIQSGGMITGHDWSYPSVQRAVELFRRHYAKDVGELTIYPSIDAWGFPWQR
jgi:hypothetical protein